MLRFYRRENLRLRAGRGASEIGRLGFDHRTPEEVQNCHFICSTISKGRRHPPSDNKIKTVIPILVIQIRFFPLLNDAIVPFPLFPFPEGFFFLSLNNIRAVFFFLDIRMR